MRIVLLATAATVFLAACSSTPKAPPAAPAGPTTHAAANLASASGSLVSGRVTLVSMPGGAHVTGVVGGLPANGKFGFHVHEKGDCSAVDATSAGGHFNPATSSHGRVHHGTHHAGDMDNLQSDAEGVATISAHLSGVTLGDGSATDIAGRAVIVHADPDDYVSQPTGNAGARVACGVIAITH